MRNVKDFDILTRKKQSIKTNKQTTKQINNNKKRTKQNKTKTKTKKASTINCLHGCFLRFDPKLERYEVVSDFNHLCTPSQGHQLCLAKANSNLFFPFSKFLFKANLSPCGNPASSQIIQGRCLERQYWIS